MTDTTANPSAWSLLRCPKCHGELEEAVADSKTEASSLQCLACKASFPLLAGIPLLMEQPDEWRNRWSEGLGQFVQQMDVSEKQLLIEFLEGDLSDRSKNRVRQVVEGIGAHRHEVLSLMQRAGINPKEPSPETKGIGHFSPETYFTLIHRDYGWAPEVDEVEVSWQRLLKILPEGFKLGKTLVLGAGTGRLAWQLASKLDGSAPVIALDVNPLPFIVTALLQAGEELSLTELPAHPRRSAVPSMLRALSCPLPPTPGLSLVFADGLNPPVEPGSFDTIITPWFVDQVPEDASTIPELVHSLLCEGGSYICSGPFLYDTGRTEPALRYCADEYLEHIRGAGFEVTKANYSPEPYIASPLSTQGRSEHVLYLHARKDSSVKRNVRKETPAYLKRREGASLPVPRPEGLENAQFSAEIISQVASLIDGKMSVLKMTGILIERGALADDGTADAAIRGCLKAILKQLAAQ